MGARVPVPDERMQRVIDMLKSTSPLRFFELPQSRLGAPDTAQPPFASCPESCVGSCHLAFNGVGRHRVRHGPHYVPGPTRRGYHSSLASLASSARHHVLTPIRDRDPTATTLTCLATFPLHPVHSCSVPSHSPVPVSSLPCLLSPRTPPPVPPYAVNKKHLRKLWAKFRKYDKDKSGAIDMDEFYALIHEKRCIFGDSIFELIDIDNNGTALRTAMYCIACEALCRPA